MLQYCDDNFVMLQFNGLAPHPFIAFQYCMLKSWEWAWRQGWKFNAGKYSGTSNIGISLLRTQHKKSLY